MWQQSYSITTKQATKEQMWKLFADVNKWHFWDEGIEFARMEWSFEQGNHFILRPNGGPNVKIEIFEAIPNEKFVDLTRFPLAKMYGTHTFEDTPEGLKITTTMRVEWLFAWLWAKLVAQGIVDGLEKEMSVQVAFASKL